MGGLMDKIKGNEVTQKQSRSLTKPASQAKLPAKKRKNRPGPSKELPTATVIYGIGGALIFVDALSLLADGLWFTGFMVTLIGCCLMGFALHYLKHQD
ncbi:MAG: hypothetical protein PHE27_09425 [Alphaproteobacteria bacterium]|nr:hypothetical protein [Alphaproteobacteria bacterium]